MNRTAILRFGVFAALLVALSAAGLVTFDLPWGDPDFRVSSATVLVYLAWSLAGSCCACQGRSTARLVLYAVLLVSAVDSFLLGMTKVEGLFPLRWAGTAILAVGSLLVMLSGPARARLGSCLQGVGLAMGLGSIAGAVCAAFAAVIVLRTAEDPGADAPAPDGADASE